MILAAYFMILLDNSIVFTGLSRIRADLGFSTAGLSWVQNAYALVFGGLLLLGARAGDLLGRRRVFVFGLIVFSAASLAIGLSPTGEWMLIARGVQGIGSAVLAPSSLALLQATFPDPAHRTRAVAAYGTTAGIGASLGLVVGGVLADVWSWRIGFLINVPIGVVLLLATLRIVQETQPVRGRFDIAGAVTSTLGMSALVYGITRSADNGWTDPVTITALAAGVAVLALFVAVESRAQQPILPLRVFANRTRAGAFVARLLFAGAIFGYFFYVSQYLQGVLGFSPLQAGLGFLPMTAVQFAIALQVPRLVTRFELGRLIVFGLLVVLIGMLWLSRIGSGSDYWTAVALPMVLLGAGQGFAFAPLTAAGITAVDARDAGAAAGLVNVAHQLGGALGVSVMVSVAAGTAPAGTSATAFAAQASNALITASLLLAVALLAAVTLIGRRRSETTARPTERTNP